MSARKNQKPKKTPSKHSGQGIILVFGENPNDSKSIRELALWKNSAILDNRIQVRRNPPSLTRHAGSGPVRSWVEKIQSIVRAEEALGRRVTAVLVHRDADKSDPAGAEEQRLLDQLAPIHNGKPVVPVQMMEAWWLLFPDAIESVKPTAWKNTMPRRGQNVENLANPKATLIQHTRWNKPQREYQESDSVAIAQKIRETNPKPLGQSASFDRFVTMVQSIK